MQTVKIDLGFTENIPAFFCPFTGENLMEMEGFEKASQNMLISVAWSFPDEPMHGNEEIIEKYQTLFDKLDQEGESDPTQVLEELLKDTDCIIFEVTYESVACGPIWERLNYVYSR